MVYQWFDHKTIRTVFSGMTSKPVVMVFSNLASKPVVMISPGLASKSVASHARVFQFDLKTGGAVMTDDARGIIVEVASSGS
jgi:hypothetical protein